MQNFDPKYFFQLLSHMPRKSKRKFKIGKSFRPVFLRVGPALQHPSPNPTCEAGLLPCACLSHHHPGSTCRCRFPQSPPCSGRSPPSARFWPNRDTSVWPRLPRAAPSHPLAAIHRLQTESSPRVTAHRCLLPQHAAMPWPSACRQGTRAALPAGSNVHASPTPPPSPSLALCSSATHECMRALFVTWRMPFRRMAPRRSLPPLAWHGQPPRTKLHSFVSHHGRYRCCCHRAKAALLPSTHVQVTFLSCLALTCSAQLRIALTRAPIKCPPPCHLSVPPPLPPSGKLPPSCLSSVPPCHRCQATSPAFCPRVQVPELHSAPELLPDQLKSLLPCR
jgi:hypothetical protein